MNAVIYLDVPDWQIGQDVSIYFPDTMVKHCKCELLKEQEAVEPKFVMNEWRCGACGHVVLTYNFDINEGKMGKVMANYCPSCGRSVKW